MLKKKLQDFVKKYKLRFMKDTQSTEKNIFNMSRQKMQGKTGKRIFMAIFFGVGGTIVSKALLMLFNVIAARLLSETKYGIYSIINNTVQTFTVFAGAGIGVTLTRYVALYRDKNKALAGIIIKTLLLFNIILSLIVAVCMFIFSVPLSHILSENLDISLYLKITSLTIFFTSFALILQSILQGFEEFKKIACYQVLSNFLMVIFGIVLTFFWGITGTVVTLMILQILMSIFFGIIIKKRVKNDEIVLKFELNDKVKEAIKIVAIPAFLASIFVVPILWITNFQFTKFNGYEEFAAFSVCLQWFTILNYLPQQLGQVKPIYTQMYDNGEIEKLKQVVKKMMKFSICFVSIVAICLVVASPILLSAYGSFYTNYKLPFIIMIISSIFFAIQSQYGSIFQAIGKIWMCLCLNVLWSVVFIFCFIFLFRLGAIGYTLSYLISYAFYSIISLICFYKIVLKKEVKK